MTPVPAITDAVFTAGADGILAGTSLDRLPSTITVDGHPAALVARTPGEARFPMPAGLPCEVDGRPIHVEAGAARITRPLRVPGTVSLLEGENQVLDPSRAPCVRLPGGGAEYVLTALHPAEAYPVGSEADANRVDTLFTVETITGEAAPAWTAIPRRAVPVPFARPRETSPRRRVWSASSYSPDPIPHDPRYATAGIGDRARFVDFSDKGATVGFCDQPAARLPGYEAQVVALAGRTVIAVDLRTPGWAGYTTEAARAFLQKVAEIADPLLVPTMRNVFDPAFQPIRGGGGRHYVLLTSHVAPGTATAGDNGTDLPRSVCAAASEMIVQRHHAPAGWTPGGSEEASELAGTIVHEYAHEADMITAYRRGAAPAGGWLGEAFAVQAEETAARLALGRIHGAREDELPGVGPRVSYLFAGRWGARPEWSPYHARLGAGSLGSYAHGASMLLFARERLGETVPGAVPIPLYLRLMELGTWDLATLASLVGMTPPEFHSAWMLAYATDDLAPAGSALPRFGSWDNAGRAPGPGARPVAGRTRIVVGPGNFGAVYFLNRDPGDRTRGASFRIEDVTGKPSVVRLTRIR